MIVAAIALLCVAVVLGLSLVVLGLRYRRGSLVVAMAHIGAALLGLGLLMTYVFSSATHKLYNIAALLLALALCGGLVLLALRVSKREYRTPPPMFVVALHAVMALIGLLLLVMGYTRP